MTPLQRLFGYSAALKAGTPPVGRRLQVRGRHVHVVERGAPSTSAVPIVLIHGASGNVLDWQCSILDDLACEHPVIAIDRPGFGYSDPAPADAWTLGAQVAQMRGAIAALGHRRYALVGHSYGGAVAMRWALDHPDEVAGVVSLSGATMDWGGDLGLHYRMGSAPVIGPIMAQAVRFIAGPDYLAGSIAEVFAPQAPPPGYIEAGGVRLALRPATFRMNALMTNRLYPQLLAQIPRYRDIALPVEVVHGTADTIVPAAIHAAPLADAVQHAAVTLLDGIGHMPHHAAAGAVIAAINRLMTRL